jgi:hypothetical protein
MEQPCVLGVKCASYPLDALLRCPFLQLIYSVHNNCSAALLLSVMLSLLYEEAFMSGWCFVKFQFKNLSKKKT